MVNRRRKLRLSTDKTGIQRGMFYDFSNYGVHERLEDDGLTTWHPAFLALGRSLEECAVKYKGFCQKYRAQEKPVKKNRWGSKLLAEMKPDKKGKKPPPGQLRLFWDEVDMGNEEIIGVATKFVKANCYSPNPKLF